MEELARIADAKNAKRLAEPTVPSLYLRQHADTKVPGRYPAFP
jgi:hypothetical protein